MAIFGHMLATYCDYYTTQLEIKIDTRWAGEKVDAQKRIRELMEERGWTDYRLAKEAGLSHSTVTNMFNRNNAPTLPTLEAVCKAFRITLGQFFSEGNEDCGLTPEQRELFARWYPCNEMAPARFCSGSRVILLIRKRNMKWRKNVSKWLNSNFRPAFRQCLLAHDCPAPRPPT